MKNNNKTKFYRAKSIRLHFGSIFDYKGNLIDIKKRQLDRYCEKENSNTPEIQTKHQWLLLPHEIGQKEYVMCLCCHEHSHL